MNFLSSGESQDTYNFADSVNYEVINTQEDLERSVEILLQEKMLAVDTENTGLNPHSGNPLILQIGTSHKCYIYPAYTGLDLSPLKRILENKDILKILFNAVYDYKWIFVKYDIKMVNMFCCQVAERLLTVGKIVGAGYNRRASLATCISKYLGIELKKEARNAFIDRDPIANPLTDKEFQYAAADVVLLPDLFFQQSYYIEKDRLEKVTLLENGSLPVFAEMEVYGSLVDRSEWEVLLAEVKKRHSKLSIEIHKHFSDVVSQKNLFGLPSFNLDSTAQLLVHLKKLGFDLPDTEEETVKKYKSKHPVFAMLVDYRGYNTILKRYGEKFLSKIHPTTGRIHANFNQLEADTGRASSSKPNLQQVPSYDEDDPDSIDFRSCFKARAGYKLVTADFSQQELRILADCSQDPVLCKAYTTVDANGKDLDVHTYTASVVFNIPYDKINKKGFERRTAKTLNFLLVYGGGAKTLAERLGIEEDEAQKIIDDYFARYAKIKKTLDKWANDTINKGYSETISGRKRWLPLPPQDHAEFDKIKGAIKRQGKNNPVQGGGADVTKQAMIYVYNAIKDAGYDARILMVVHDEIVVEAREDQAEAVAKLLESNMIKGFSHFFKKIPMKVDVNISNTWEK